jgi:hypothetical protein
MTLKLIFNGDLGYEERIATFISIFAFTPTENQMCMWISRIYQAFRPVVI